MPTVVEEIPTPLQPAANAALAWINSQQSANYKLTALVDPDLSWQVDAGMPTDMALVLCNEDTCVREQVRIQKLDDGFQITAIEAADSLILEPSYVQLRRCGSSGYSRNLFCPPNDILTGEFWANPGFYQIGHSDLLS